jgi:hypothetical protein
VHDRIVNLMHVHANELHVGFLEALGLSLLLV